MRLGIQVTEYPLRVRKYTPSTLRAADLIFDSIKALARTPGLIATKKAEVTWLERELIARRCSLEKYAGTRRVFDVDDAIWLTSNRSFSEEIARSARAVIAGNEHIAKHYRAEGIAVSIIPTCVDTDVWLPGASKGRRWTIGWIGTSSNFEYLYALESALAAFLADHADTQLLVVSDRKPTLSMIPNRSLVFLRWSETTEVKSVQSMDVGIMPLANTEWELGKCASKMLLYMAVGIPSVVTPVGTSKEILVQGKIGYAASAPDGWYDSLCALFDNTEEANAMGRVARKLAETRYSVTANVGKLADVFRAVSSD